MKTQFLSGWLILYLLSFFSYDLFSQKLATGIITDINNKPIEFVTVALISENNNMIIQSVYSDSLGSFTIKTNNWNNCFLSIYAFGYNYKRVYLQDTNTNLLNFGNIKIENLSSTLSEITIIGQKEIIQTKVDRIIFNVEKLISLEGETAIDVLKKTPGVSLNNNNISIIGKGNVNIMINNKMLNLTGENLINYLQSISSDNIQRIEIISNPPSKYDSEGNSGLVNIILKKQKNDGFNASINNRYKQSFYGNWNSDASLYYVTKRINLSSTIGYGKIHKRHLYNFNSTYKNFGSEEKGISEREGDNYKAQLSFDYNITDKITIGALFIGSMKQQTNNVGNNIIFTDKNYNIDSMGYFISAGAYSKYDYSINFHFQMKFDTTEKLLSIDADNFRYYDDNQMKYSNKNFYPNGTLTNKFANNKNQTLLDITVNSLKVDYYWPLKFLNLSFGGKISQILTNNDNKLFDINNKILTINSQNSNIFSYNELNNALYFEANKTFGKFQQQIGIRGESTETKGNSKTLNQITTKKYYEFFPTFFTQYTISNNYSLNLSFGKRINRPNYQDLNPFKYYISSSSYVVGNPNLIPSISYNSQIQLSIKNKIFLGFYHSFVKNEIMQTPITYQDSTNTFLELIPLNIGESQNIGFNIYYTTNLTKWWVTYSSFVIGQNKMTFFSKVLKNYNSLFIGLNSNNIFYLNKTKKIIGEINGYCNPPGVKYGPYTLGLNYSVDFSFRVKLFHDKGSLKLSIEDIFNSSTPYAKCTTNGNIIENHNNFDSRVISVGFLYKFGKSTKTKSIRLTGNNEEKNRVK